MKGLHSYMKEGRYRLAEAILLSVFFLSVLYGVLNEINLGVIGNFFKVSAAVVTASGVVAYNLRNRVVDFSKYLISRSPDFDAIAKKTKESCHRLTFIVFFSFISGVLCMLAGIHVNVHIMAIAGVGFIFSTVWYAHIIFAFDELEEKMLDTAMENRQLEEEQKRKQFLEEGRREHPDNF